MPRVVAPSVNVTVPVGVPLAPATVAVKVTGWPKVEGLSDETRVVVFAVVPGPLPALTTWVTTLEVLVA